MADNSSFMDWEPQTPPPPFNPYQGQYVPGGWPMTPPPPQTTGLFDPPRRRTRTEWLLDQLPDPKRLCQQIARGAYRAATTVVTVPTVAVVRQVRQLQQARAARPPRRRLLRNRVIAATPERPATPVRDAVVQTQTPPPSPLQQTRVEVTPRPKKQEKKKAARYSSFPHEVPEFRPAYILNQMKQNKNKTASQKTIRRTGPKHALSSIPKIPPPQGQKPVILATPEQIVAKPLPEADRVQLQSPYPPLVPESALAPSPQTPADTSTSDETSTPSTQLQGELHASTPAAHTQKDLQTSTESEEDENTIISSVENSRKRRSNIQGSRATTDGETSSSKRPQAQGPSAASPITPTPNPAIVVQGAPVAVEVQEQSTPVDTSLLTPTRFRNRKFSTPTSLLKKLHKKPQTPQADESILSSTCGASPGNYHLDEVRSPAKSEISSFFQGTPPALPKTEIRSPAKSEISSFFQGTPPALPKTEVRSPAKSEISSFFQGTPPAHSERKVDILNMITAGGGGSPVPALENTPKSEETTETSGSIGRDATLQSSGEGSTGNKSAVEETEEETKKDVTPLAEATTETMEAQSGLANQEAAPESNISTDANEQSSSKDAKESPILSTEATTATASTPIDLTDDNDDEEADASSTSTTSGPSTPEKQLAQLKLNDERYHTPERPTPKASPHSLEKTTRKTRGDLKREKLESEKKNLYTIAALPAAWEEKIQHALRHGHNDYKSSDFRRVIPPSANNNGTAAWLNDEVINGYLNLIVQHGKANDRPTQVPSFHTFSSFFYNNLVQKGYDSVKRWSSRAKIGGKNLLEVQGLFIPINNGAHWTLLVVSGKDRSATHYNSMRGSGGAYIKAIKTWLAAELGASYNEEEWTFVEAGESPMQANMDDCGVFTITSARQIMLGLTPMSYGPGEIPLQRKRIVAELVAGGLLKSNA
ncbi:hypothetical protein H2200_003778 [Cladophialophora chaetospira]|uniref:Ubiquitin-like protease family profile domain-containing protein n=1 Tax=Cladophialophora chaetospira TaxID=386627 RepID=A0AA38XFI5_9EURO|nr:hypothetical protein H2200_003778 [Cladophialophora chaetospira]